MGDEDSEAEEGVGAGEGDSVREGGEFKGELGAWDLVVVASVTGVVCQFFFVGQLA